MPEFCFGHFGLSDMLFVKKHLKQVHRSLQYDVNNIDIVFRPLVTRTTDGFLRNDSTRMVKSFTWYLNEITY